MNWLSLIVTFMLFSNIQSELLTIEQPEIVIFRYQGNSLSFNKHTWRETSAPHQNGIFAYYFSSPMSLVLSVNTNQGEIKKIEKIAFPPLWQSHDLGDVRGFPGKPKMIFNGTYYLEQPTTIRIVGMINTRSFSGGCHFTSTSSPTHLRLLINHLPIDQGIDNLVTDITLEQDPGLHSISVWGENKDLSFCACPSTGNGFQISKHLMVISLTPSKKEVVSPRKMPQVIVQTVYQGIQMINETISTLANGIKQRVGDVLFDGYLTDNKRKYVTS